ncbi:MAG: adenylate/guanylate cyclase domain-containing protein [Acuticoccus sp.]
MRNVAWIPRLRLATGLIMFAFVLGHYLNHALGLWSLALMEAVGDVRRAVWQSAPGTVLLAGAFVIHMALALHRTARRRTWRMPPAEALQLALGLTIPVMMIDHVVGTRGLQEMFGIKADYQQLLSLLWPGLAVWQTTFLLVVWVHATIGLRYWLASKSFYPRIAPLLLTLAVLIPALATAGWIGAARRLELAGLKKVNLTREAIQWADPLIEYGRMGLIAAVLAALVIGILGALGVFSGKRVTITYPGGRQVRARPGQTVLEVSREQGIPHTAVCGGRARCSTCRTRILKGLERLPAPSPREKAVLERIRAPANVRLACQLRPQSNVTVQPLVPGRLGEQTLGIEDSYRWGVEQQVAILFADLRGFTALSERRLAFDVVFILNEYLGLMSELVRKHDGVVDKYIGDSVMAIYGIATRPEVGARQALATAAEMMSEMDRLNARLSAEVAETLRMGIGIHAGPAILGRIGGGASAGLTALGDTVNIASRLESATKDLETMLAVSDAVTTFAGADPSRLRREEITLRGRSNAITVYAASTAGEVRQALSEHV